MAEVEKPGMVAVEESMVSSLAQADALPKILIDKGLISEAEFTTKLSAGRTSYQAIVHKISWPYKQGLSGKL